MKVRTASLRTLRILAIAASLALVGNHVAQAAENRAPAWGLITAKGSATPYDALWLVMGDPADPGANKNLIWANMDLQYNFPSYSEWESVTWRPASSFPTQRFPASLLGTDWSTSQQLDRNIELRNLTLERADLDAQNVQFRFYPIPPVPGATTSLTLNNGSLTGLTPPGFNVDANLTLTASGDSTLGHWGKGPVGSRTTLNVTPGSRLTLFRLGNFANGTIATDSWYFSHAGNVATIDGGTLRVDQSYVTFGRLTGLADPAVASRMTFQNGAVLDIVGERGRLDSGSFSFLNSRVNLGSGNRLKAADTVLLNGATLTTDEDSKLVTEVLDVYGNNSIALGKQTRSGGYIVTTGAMAVRPDALLTLNGQDVGSLAVTFQLLYDPTGPGQQQGRIVISDNAVLVNSGAMFDIRPDAPITINRTSDAVSGALVAENGGTVYLRASAADTGQVTNHGQIVMGADSALVAIGPVIIQGGSEGLVSIGSAGALIIGNSGTALAATQSLTTQNRVELDNFSTLQLTLDPTALSSGQLRAGGTLNIAPFAELHLALANDKVLPGGTKFTLIGYGAFASAKYHYFNGYPDGSTVVLGLNHYRINYADTPDPGYLGAITLTVVPAVPSTASLSPAAQTLAGTVGTNIAPSATLVPGNFGGTVTYAITPDLPSGLSINPSTGVIGGWPAAAWTTATHTITGRGSSSGVATATVTLTINRGGQAITFGPAPAPNYLAGGGFLVSASASSGLPVTYSSLTPSVCTAGGSTVFMLSAGACTIAANQAGNANYLAAPPVTQTITIAKAQPAPLTLSAIPENINVGETSALGTSGGNGTGAISLSVTGSCSIVGTTLTGNAAGTCTVRATQAADANYNAGQSNPVNITVGTGAQVRLVLTATPSNLGVNGTSVLSTTGGSGTGAVTYAVIGGPCTLTSSSTLRGDAEGKCQVVATKAADGIYGAATSSPVTLTVNLLVPPALMLSASPASVGFGGGSTLSTSGGVGGAPVTYGVTGPCSVSGNILIGSSAGNCTVTASQAATAVYGAVTSNTVVVTVKERNTTFSYPQSTAIIGQPFILTPNTSGFTTPKFALLYGTLPAGLTLNAQTGVISGIPTGPVGTSDFVISAYAGGAYDAALVVVSLLFPVEPVPTLSEWGLAILSSLMAVLAGWHLRRRERRQ